MNLFSVKVEVNLAYHCREACFNPYKGLLTYKQAEACQYTPHEVENREEFSYIPFHRHEERHYERLSF